LGQDRFPGGIGQDLGEARIAVGGGCAEGTLVVSSTHGTYEASSSNL
jgi:hypothetical protein